MKIFVRYFSVLFPLLMFLVFIWYVFNHDIVVLSPHGSVAVQQRDLMVTATLLLLIVAIPLLTTLYYFVFRYSRGNKTNYSQHKLQSKFTQFSWWIIPSVIIAILSVIVWDKTHALDPYRPLESQAKPVKIQVVALQWKWLFIYPEYNIATVNFIQIPEQTPINFELTADAPMNSFWIPALSGQIYAMTGMSTKLHMIADKSGDYQGKAAEINGKGFSGMKFVTRVSSSEEFSAWIEKVKRSPQSLSWDTYTILARPSENTPVYLYQSVEKNLYNKIMEKFGHEKTIQMPPMNHE